MKKKNFWLTGWPTVLEFVFLIGGVALARFLERPFSGIAVGLGLLLGCGIAYLAKHKREKLGEDIELDDDDIDEFDDDFEDDFDIGETPESTLLIMGYPNDRIYVVFDVGTQYYLYPVGNEAFGIKPDKLPDGVPTYSQMMDTKKSLIIDKSSISEFSLEMKTCISTPLPSCAALHITTNGSKKKFIVLGDGEERDILGFFSDIAARRTALTEGQSRRGERRTSRKEADLEFGRELAERRDESKLKKYKTIGTVLTVIAAIVAVGTLFFCEPYEVWIGLCYIVFAIALILIIFKSNYYSFVYNRSESMKKYGVELYSLLGALMLPMGALLLRTALDITFVSWTKILIYTAVTAVVLTVLICLGSKEVRRKIGNILIVFLFMAMFSMGIPGEINYILDDYYPAQTVKCEISDKHISKSSKGPDEYYITVDREGEDFDVGIAPEEYEELSIGDKVTVGYYDGALGIEYALLWSLD